MRSLKERLTTFQRLSDRLGPARVLWRYDPIILSNTTPLAYHLDRIDTLAGHLQGHTERLTISFLDFTARQKNGWRARKSRASHVLMWTGMSTWLIFAVTCKRWRDHMACAWSVVVNRMPSACRRVPVSMGSCCRGYLG